VNDYPFEQLDHTAFQQFTSALCSAVFGPVLQPMGPGPDGGRDLFTGDRLAWRGSEVDHAFDWQGYSVVQVKQKEKLEKANRDAAWLITEIRKELDAWNGSDAKRRPVPDQILFVTNVPLSATPETGGRDKVDRGIASYLKSVREERSGPRPPLAAVRDIRVWDRYMLRALLTAHESVRKAFIGFLTVGDVLALLTAISGELRPEELEPALRAQTRRALLDEQWVYFREAGAHERTPLADVVVDLPVVHHASGQRSTIFKSVLERAGMNLRVSAPYTPEARHLVIAGAPGNGKTTISQFLTQVFRSSFVSGDSLVQQQQAVVEATIQALDRLRQRPPGNRRWPIRIDLATYVQNGRHQVRFLRSLAALVSDQSDNGNVSATNIYTWLRSWPWIVVFDGLDEVANAATRSRLIEEIEQFASMVDEQNADVLIVVTTRPSGYDNDLDPKHFDRLDLDYLRISEALRYGELVTINRLRSDQTRAEQVVKALRTAAIDPTLRLLMRTPLQVAILSIIVEGGQPPADRYGLFWEYYETVLKRERAKPTEFADVLKKHATVVTRLHERVGFALQAKSEVAEGSAATITRSSLERILKDDLAARGFDLDGNDVGLVDEVNRAGADRLLLIGPQSDGDLGFDVRSVQELMAARYLTSGDDEEVCRVLRIAAPSPHWRNTWLFAAGRIFIEDAPHRQDQLLHLLQTLDQDEHARLSLVSPVGPYLALELVGEGIAENVPRTHVAFLKESFKVLEHPYVPNTQLAASIWVDEARNPKYRDRLDTIKSALEAWVLKSDLEARTAAAVVRDIATHVRDTDYLQRVKDLGSIRRPIGATVPPPPAGVSLAESAELAMGLAPSDAVATLIQAVFDDLISQSDENAVEPSSALSAALADPDAAYIIDGALHELSVESREIVVRALRHVHASRRRRPVGEELDSKKLLRFLTSPDDQH
jgi:hypothetical protein